MVSTPVKTIIPPKTEQAPVYTLDKVSEVVPSWILWDNTRYPDMKPVGRIGQCIAPEKEGKFWVALAGHGASPVEFDSVQLAETYLIALYEQRLATGRMIANALVAEYGR